jgi:glycosyltransferase involved in cell wall biosynthesis
MRIAIVTSSGANPMGPEPLVPSLLWLIERLVRAGDDVHVFCLTPKTKRAEWSLLGARIYNARHSASRLFRQMLVEHSRAPFDAIHTLWSVRANLVAIAAAKLLRAPVLLYFGGGEFADLPTLPGFDRLASRRGRAMLRLVCAGADRIGVQSAYLVEKARTLGLPVERMPLGVALDRWPPLPPRRRIAGAAAKLLHVAHISPVKDHEMLFEALVRLKAQGFAFTLDLIGIDCAQDGATERRANTLGLSEHVRFHGFVPHHAMRPFFEAADVLLLSSRYEAGPLVVLEAAVAGVPTVGTKVGHLIEWAPDAARAVAPRDSAGFAVALADLLSDEDMRLRLAVEAQKRALVENADVTTAYFRQVYREMCAGTVKQGLPSVSPP